MTLSSPTQVVTWSGSNPDPTGQGLQPQTDATCNVRTAAQATSPAPCDVLNLRIDLDLPYALKGSKYVAPAGVQRDQVYSEMPGDGILVGIKWATDFDQWNLYVDNIDGSPVASSQCLRPPVPSATAVACGTEVDSNAQVVLVPPPPGAVNMAANATHWHASYTIKVIPVYTDFVAGDKTYAGEARLFLDPTQRRARKTALLPRIETPAPAGFHVSGVPPIPSNPTGWRWTSADTFPTSCYLEETAQRGSTRCLRFDNTIANVGEGPLTLEFNYDAGALATAIRDATSIPVGQCHMNQQVLYSDGTATLNDAGPCIYHTQHMHFHYQNMGRYQLFAVRPDGSTGGIPVPRRGQRSAKPVAISDKVGYCVVDVDYLNFGKAAALQHPRTYTFPVEPCNVPNANFSPGQTIQHLLQSAGAPEFQGVSPGWGDVYTWDLPGQYIDISHVPDGVYEVVSSANFDGGIKHVADRRLETGVTCVQLITNVDGTTVVKVLKEFPSQPNDAPLPACRITAGR